MEDKNLSRRLRRVAQYIQKGDRLADIGSDHAYLPTVLVQEGIVSFAVAGEVAKGPFERAQKEVENLRLQHKIDVRLGDGLNVIHPEDAITTVTICGMGGVLIKEILDRGYLSKNLSGNERLILQPNVGEPEVRKWLYDHQYDILFEELVEEKGKLYEIIVAEASAEDPAYTEADFKYGVHLRREKPPLFKKKWTQEIKKAEYIMDQLSQSQTPQTEKIKELTRQIEEMKGMIS